MITLGHSDLAAAMALSAQSLRVKESMTIAGSELSTGANKNLVEATAGDLGKLFAIDRTISRLDSEFDAIQIARGKASLSQVALGNIHENIVDFGPQLLSAVERGDIQSSILVAEDARQALGAVISSLNARYGRHSIFAGAALDRQAIASSETIIGDIAAIVASAADAGTALTLIDDYFFSPNGGYESSAFLGSAQDAPPLREDGGEEINYATRADSMEIRKAMRSLVIAAVASDAPNFVGTTNQIVLLREAGNSAIGATAEVTSLREKLGFAEGRIENMAVRNRTMGGVFELERSSIISVDPFEAATKFEELQVQLQTIYTITARLSNLTLTNFLR